MVFFKLCVLLLLTAPLNGFGCLAHRATSGDAGTGLIGYGISMWQPPCAYACRRSLSLSPLDCSIKHEKETRILQGRHGGHEAEFTTSPDCFSTDRNFRLSLAWCMHQHCTEEHESELWRLERFWEIDVAPGSSQASNLSYTEAVELCDDGLKPIISQGQPLREPSALSQGDYAAIYTYVRDYSRVETQHSRYGIILFISMVILPLVFPLAQFVIAATSRTWERKLLAHLIQPAFWSRRHLVSLPYDIGLAPLRGQTLLITFIIILNLVLSLVRYEGSMPSFKYESESAAYWTYLSNRAGYLSFVNLVVVFLYSGRNNPLMALSTWDYGTFILLHRWVAYICVAQASTHSLIKLYRHIPFFSEVFAKLYWNIGFGAFVTFAVIFATSTLPFRRRWYQAFMDIHIILAVAALILCFFHVYVKFGYKWGFENWVVFAAILWAGERVARLFKIASHGVRTATVTPLDGEYFEVSAEGVSEIGYVYLYFPKGWWRAWENHPFSVASGVNPLAMGTHRYTTPNSVREGMFELGSDDDSDAGSVSSEHIQGDDTVAMLGHSSQDIRLASLASGRPGTLASSPTTPLNYVERVGDIDEQGKLEDSEADTHLLPSGNQAVPRLSFLVRRQKGLTSALFSSNQPQTILIEGPYSSISTLPSLSMATAQIVCIVGGSGIAAVLPLLRSRATVAVGRTVLHWSCRSEALVKASEVRDLSHVVETNISIGQRMDIEDIIRHEARDLDCEVAIVTCGPGGMADDVRHAVVEANRRIEGKGLLRLYEECYSW